MEIIGEVKAALRLTTRTFDESEVKPLIAACRQDLELAGIKNIQDSDPLIRRAHVLYAKAHFGYSENSERFLQHYLALRDNLSLSKLYTQGAIE